MLKSALHHRESNKSRLFEKNILLYLMANPVTPPVHGLLLTVFVSTTTLDKKTVSMSQYIQPH